MFLRFFQYFAKTTIFYQKRFEGVIFYYHYNLWFKYSKEWSGTSVRMLAWSWSFEQQAEKLKKWTNALHFQLCPQLFVACPNTFETSWNPASCRYLRFARPYRTSAVNPNRMDSCVWNIPNTLETNLSIQKKKLGGAVVKRNTITMLSIIFLRYIEKKFFPLPSPQKQNRFKLLAQARELFLNLRNAFRIDTRRALFCWFAVAMSNSACIWTHYSKHSICVYTEQKKACRIYPALA